MKTTFQPENLKRWTMPDCYCGETWPDYFRAPVAIHRDSDCLTESNWHAQLAALGGEQTAEDDTPLVCIVRESHWAVGWVEWLAIHETAGDALRIADNLAEKLDSYPVLDEDDWSEREQTAANNLWRDCYTPKERVRYIREHESQFEFRNLADMLGCIRGNYFAGYASELVN